jgi:hypothetical protein
MEPTNMKQSLSIDQLIEVIETNFNKCTDNVNTGHLAIGLLQALATAHVAKQTERQVDALNGCRAAIEQLKVKLPSTRINVGIPYDSDPTECDNFDRPPANAY